MKNEVLRVAFKHHLVSKYTSLVAVDITPSRPTDVTLEKKAVKSKMPSGFSQVTHQPLLMASGATNSQLFILAGLLFTGLFGFMFIRSLRSEKRLAIQ